MNRTLKHVSIILIYTIMLIVVAFLAETFVVKGASVNGSSMETTLQDGNKLAVDILSYRISDPKRFDIVILKYLHEEDTFYIKRIVGLPGETVQIKDGEVYIDDKELEEDVYCDEEIEDPGIAEDPIVLEEGEYFVLGDNRNDSSDSRDEDVGVVKKEQLVGKAVFRIRPLDEIGAL